MSMADAFAPIEAHYRAQIQAETWGHLAPKKNTTYRGRFVYAVGCYGNDHLNPTVLVCEFADLDDSPWFVEALLEFIRVQAFEVGYVYEFRGSVKNYVFRGHITTILNTHAVEGTPL